MLEVWNEFFDGLHDILFREVGGKQSLQFAKEGIHFTHWPSRGLFDDSQSIETVQIDFFTRDIELLIRLLPVVSLLK